MKKKRIDEVESLFNQLDIQAHSDNITWILPDVPRLYPEIIQLMKSAVH